jgi:hypothetical protein
MGLVLKGAAFSASVGESAGGRGAEFFETVEMSYEKKLIMHRALVARVRGIGGPHRATMGVEEEEEDASCSPEFLACINKHLWVDDAKLVKRLKINLGLAQSSGGRSGIFQHADHPSLAPIVEERWPSVMIPGACSGVLKKDPATGCDVAKRDDFPPATYPFGTRGGPHRHVGEANPLVLESERYPEGGSAFFDSELGSGGCVGLYVRKIEKSKRFDFLKNHGLPEEAVFCRDSEKLLRMVVKRKGSPAVVGRVRTFSTFRYKYYLIVRCTAGRRACEVYESLVRGIGVEKLRSDPSFVDDRFGGEGGGGGGGGARRWPRPVTIGDLACSTYYSLYVKQCAENARRLAFRYAKCLQISVPLCRRGTRLPPGARLRTCEGAYECPELVWGSARETDVALHRVEKTVREEKVGLMTRFAKWFSIGGSNRYEPTPGASSSTSTVAVAEDVDDFSSFTFSSTSSSSSAGSSATSRSQEEGEDAAATLATMPGSSFPPNAATLRWKKKTMKLDPSVGVPPVCQEKRMQFDGCLKLIVSHASSEFLYVQVHGETASIDVGEAIPNAIPRDASAWPDVLVRLPPLQGYASVKLKRAALDVLKDADHSARVISTAAVYHRESSLTARPLPCSLPLLPSRTEGSFPEGDYFEPRVSPEAFCGVAPVSFESHGCGCNVFPGAESETVALNKKHGSLFRFGEDGPSSSSSDCEREERAATLGENRSRSLAISCSGDSDEEYDGNPYASDRCSSCSEEEAESRCPVSRELELKKLHGKTKNFQTELLYDVSKNQMIACPTVAVSFEGGRTCRLDRQPVMAWLAHDEVHRRHYDRALESAYYLPSDVPHFRSSAAAAMVNPAHHHHHRGSHVFPCYVKLEDTLRELVYRCMGGQAQVRVSCRDPGPIGEYDGLVSVSYRNEDVPAMEGGGMASEVVTGVHFTYKNYKPLLCVESLPSTLHAAPVLSPSGDAV